MRRLLSGSVVIALSIASGACSTSPEGLQIRPGSQITVEKRDGVSVSGRLIDVQEQHVLVETADGQTARVPRAEVRGLRATGLQTLEAEGAQGGRSEPPSPALSPRNNGPAASPAPAGAGRPENGAPAGERLAQFREVTVPAGTVLPIELRSSVSSESSTVEDAVHGRIRRAITVNGIEVIPVGATIGGTVTEAKRSGRVRGRARIAFRFTSLDLPSDSERVSIRTSTFTREAAGTKKQDAAKIGGAAAGGAIVGGVLGGGDGAAKGAAVGGAAGTGVVLSTRGKEVSLGPGASISVRLSSPITLRVRTS